MQVIYDFDGVMFDTKECVRMMYEDIMWFSGICPTVGQIEYCMSHSMADNINYISGQDVWDTIKSLDYKKYYDVATPNEHILEALEKFKYLGIKVSICSNRVSGIAYILDKSHVTHLIDNVVTAKEYPSKPNPESLLSIIDGPAIFVGDSDTDGQTARNVGIPFVAYNNPNIEADYHINNHMQILSLTPIKECDI